MATGIIKTEDREQGLSKGELSRLRAAGKIPANVYGKEITPISFFVNKLEFQHIYHSHGKIFEIDLQGKKHLVNAKDIQHHSVTQDIIHISFHKLKRGESTTVSVPIKTSGEAPGAIAGGMVTIVTETIKVDAVPSKIPESITVDISTLEIDGQIKVSDIKLPTGVSFHSENVDDDINETLLVSCKQVVLKEESTADEENLEPPLASEEDKTEEKNEDKAEEKKEG